MPCGFRILWCCVLGLAALFATGPTNAEEDTLPLPPSPYAILGSSLLETPTIDALPICLPEGLARELGEIAEKAAGGEFEAALEALEALDSGEEPRPAGWERLAAVLRGRLASDVDAHRAARRDLQHSLAGKSDGTVGLVCAGLELARTELQLRLLPEAGVSITRALRSTTERDLSSALRTRAQFYRAETLHLRGEHVEAEALYARLTGPPGLSAIQAGRLREIDRLYEGGRYSEALKGYEFLFDDAGVPGAPLLSWAPRAAEAALHARDLDAADYWLGAAQADADVETAAIIDIRRGDLRYLQDDLAESRRILETVARKREGEPVGELAKLRLFSLNLAGGSVEGQLEELRGLVGSAHHGIAVHARSLLVHELLETNAIDEALDEMAFLAYDTPEPAIAPGLSQDLDALLLAAAGAPDGEPDCPALLRRLGSRRALFLAHSHVSEPFLRLGDCYVGDAMPHVGLEIYRNVTKRFGPQRAEVIALRMARAALESGDLRTARAAARARADGVGAEADPWILLLADADLRDGRPETAVDRLTPLVREGRPEEGFAKAVQILARAALEVPPSKDVRDSLHQCFERLVDAAPGQETQDVGAAALYTGELHRRADERGRAHLYYARAVSLLPEGMIRAEAAYWLGTLETTAAASIAAWEIAASSPGEGSWSRLAKNELRMSRIRAEVGSSRPVARPVDNPAAVP